MRKLNRKCIVLLLLTGRNRALLILEDKVCTADNDLLVFNHAGNAVRYDILNLRVHFLVRQIALTRSADNGVRHGVREVLLQAGCNAQHVVFGATTERDNPGNNRAGMRQCAGLVKYNGICLRDSLEELAALDRDMIHACLTHGGQNRQRHSQLERTGEVNHQHGQCTGDIAGQCVAERTADQRIRHQLVRQISGMALSCTLELLGLLDHGNDLVIAALAGGLGDLDHAVAFLDDRAGVNLRTRTLCNRHGFSGKRRLIDHNFAFNNLTVQRDDAAHANQNTITDSDVGQRYKYLCVIGLEPYAFYVERHAACQIVNRLFMRPLLEQLANIQQEHNRTCRGEVPAYHRNTDGQRIEQLNLQLSVHQALETAAEERQRQPDRACNLQRRWQEQRAGKLRNNLADQLFLILTVERTTAVGRRQRRDRRCSIVKLSDRADDILAVTDVADDSTAGALVHGCVEYTRLILQIRLQQISLLQRHAVLLHAHAKPSAAFVFNECFHSKITSSLLPVDRKRGALPLFDIRPMKTGNMYLGFHSLRGRKLPNGNFRATLERLTGRSSCPPNHGLATGSYASTGAAVGSSSVSSTSMSASSTAAASASAARFSLISSAEARMSPAFSLTQSTVFITVSFMRRTAAAAWVYTFLASLLLSSLIPAEPNRVPPTNTAMSL